MQTIQAIIARALVRLAIAAAPADMAGKLREAISTDSSGGRGEEP